MLANSALRTFSMNSALSPLNGFLAGPLSTLLAATRSSFMADKKREKTDSVIMDNGTPRSSALWLVHLPVPFWPAASRITSTIGLPVSSSYCEKMSAVISIR
ncbi:hypothetical protein D1872_266960 [compost metagenome]